MEVLERDRLVTIQRATAATDDYGEGAPTWATLTTAFAKVLYGSGQERREAAQEAAAQTATFMFLWGATLAGVTVKDRIVFDGANWDITNRALVGLNREIHFTGVRVA